MVTRAGVLNALFAALYDQLAPAYDAIAALAFAGEWARWRELAARFADRTPIVEIGCGTGHTVASLSRDGLPVIGLDASSRMLAQARRRAVGRLARARAERLPLRAGSVGTILSIFPTRYILEPATWREVERALAPGGRLVVVTHGWLAPDSPRRATLAACHRLVYGGGAPVAPPLPRSALSALSIVERSRHGFASILVAAKPSEPDD
jgi:ubiquinone/menaquinone biosynthesis C-methylase UbiE